MNTTLEPPLTRRVSPALATAECSLTDAGRQPCEVWTRVMGYHRPVSSFNTGKQAEHAERRFFCDPAMRPELISVGGLARFSTVDWPGMMTAAVFCQGCGWRCRYCHNLHLIPFRNQIMDTEEPAGWTWASVAAWLRDRRGLLDAVVFSGGEPTLQPRLAEAIAQAREPGFRIGLHTGGPVPSALAEVLPLVDWVGFDFKSPFAAYARVAGRPAGDAAAASLG